MAKNPFEIRADILAMAKDYMDKQQEITMEIFKKAVEVGEKSMKDIPTLYPIKDMMDKATEFYTFVSKKD
jgi:hypothetical protein